MRQKVTGWRGLLANICYAGTSAARSHFISGDMRGSLKGLASDCANIAKLPELVRQRYCGQLQFSNSRLVQYIQVKACSSALAARSSASSGILKVIIFLVSFSLAIRLVFDHQNALAHAASTCRSTMTGSVKVNVEPWPGCDSTQIRPPCISIMRLEIASPNPVPPFFLVMALSAC